MDLIVDEFRNVLAIIVIELLLVLPCMQKRKRYFLRLCAGIIVCLMFVSLYVSLRPYVLEVDSIGLTTAFSVVWYILVVVVTGCLIGFCHKINLTEIVWVMITAYAVQHLVYVVVIELIFYGVIGSGTNVWAQLGVYTLAAAILYCATYFLFLPQTKERRHLDIMNNRTNVVMLGVFLLVFLLSTFVNQANARQDYVGINYLSVISDFVNCVLVIVVQWVGLRTARVRTEKDLLKKQLENEEKQYETFRNAVEYINIKCHDLKHQIAAMQREGNIDPERLSELTENISIYESFANTGNKTLDMLITDKNFVCKNSGISLSCVADAESFAEMSNEDIYCLFGNMLDNAIEYVKKIEQPEKRYIRLFIKSKGGLKIIHQENYCAEALEFADGLPKTTKPDKIYHGFGTKSMRHIVRKYEGEMNISVKENIFQLDIVLSK